jgi:hypothetical protein
MQKKTTKVNAKKKHHVSPETDKGGYMYLYKCFFFFLTHSWLPHPPQSGFGFDANYTVRLMAKYSTGCNRLNENLVLEPISAVVFIEFHPKLAAR